MLFHHFHGSTHESACYENAGYPESRDGPRQRRTYTPFPPGLMHTKHGNIAPVGDISMHALLADDDTHRVRRLTRISLQQPPSRQYRFVDRDSELTRNARCGLLVNMLVKAPETE